MVNWRETMGKLNLSEWMWRFLAAAMVFSVAWTAWIFYQLNPSPLIMNAAFEAAAKAKVNAGQSVQGVISQPVAAPATASPKEPPINADRLKFSESIAPPAPGATK
jgi:hypothetical protein